MHEWTGFLKVESLNLAVLIKDKNSSPISVDLITQQVEQWTIFLKVESLNLVYL
jgi:hypothetical protein